MRSAARPLTLLATAWLACGAAGCGDDEVPARHADAGPAPDAARVPDASQPANTVWLPVAPNAERFGWQGVQDELYSASDGRQCRDAEVVVGMGDRALCFVDTDDELRCAGRIYDRDFGASFELAGQTGVDQIFISMTSNSETGNSICVHRRDRTAWCLGSFNDWGQYNNGSTAPTSTWVRWGTRDDLEELATGTFDQFCGRYADGSVECVGNGYGGTPVAVGTTTLGRLWVDDAGTAHLDDLEVFRVGNGRTECRITANGVDCAGDVYGVGGKVVAGDLAGLMLEEGWDSETVCWLDDVGRVFCQYRDEHPELGWTDPMRVFMPGPIVALALDGYSSSPQIGVSPARCAVRHDGSLWCVGENESGKLGTGDTVPLLEETEVQPPRTVRIRCDEPGPSG